MAWTKFGIWNNLPAKMVYVLFAVGMRTLEAIRAMVKAKGIT
jgi:hypothetical protein